MYLSAEKLKSGALLAPMAGVADRSMRELCMEFGAIGCIGEMASSKGISMNDRKSSELLSLSDAERPAGVQIQLTVLLYQRSAPSFSGSTA